MTDLAISLHHLFNWRFLSVFGVLVALALFLPERITRPFRSVRANVFLFFAIAVAAMIGTFLPQNKPTVKAVAALGPFWANALERLGFLDLYHTWWFCGLLALMGFDVVACKLRKLPALIHGPVEAVEAKRARRLEELLARSSHRERFTSDRPADQVRERVRAWFQGAGLRVREAAAEAPGGEGAVAFAAGRQRVQRWGDFVLHVSIVLILSGNLLGALFGFTEMWPITEGQTVRLLHRPFDVRLNDFEIQYYRSSGSPSLYTSDLEVRQGDAVLARQRVIVNRPLDIDRVRFYQASWGMTTEVRSAVLRFGNQDVVVRPHEITPIPGTGLAVRVNGFYPSFEVDAKNRPINRDFEGRNPALQIDFFVNGASRARVWVSTTRPDLAYRIEGDMVSRAAPPPFRVVAVDPILFSGIQVAYDPGAPLFWFGAAMFILGLATHFYLHQRRLRVLVVPRGAGSEVFVGGWSSRGAADFNVEFARWTDEIRRRVA